MSKIKELLNATFEHLYKDENKVESEGKLHNYIVEEYKERILSTPVFQEITINNTQIAKDKIAKIRKYTAITYLVFLVLSLTCFYLFFNDTVAINSTSTLANTANAGSRDAALLTAIFAPFLVFLISLPIIANEINKNSDIVYKSIEDKYKPVLKEVTEALLSEVDLQNNDFLKLNKEKEYLHILLTNGENDFQNGKKNKLFKRIKKEISDELFKSGK